jgi:hypothetical protein
MRPRILTVACAVVFLASAAAVAGPLEGRWVLVEETYGTGGLNLMRQKPPQTIEFVREGGRLEGRTRIRPDGPEGPWPAFFVDAADEPLDVHEVWISPTEDEVRARYRTPAVRDDKVRLDIVEEYSLSEEGDSLVGTVTVTFLSHGGTRGSFVLHRRFERQP